MVLNPYSDGEDIEGIKVRAKPGLAGCEYLSEGATKGTTAIMGPIADMLRKVLCVQHQNDDVSDTYLTRIWQFGYREYNGDYGSMIGASYDWRIMPEHMERRDGFFTKMMEQTEVLPITPISHLSDAYPPPRPWSTLTPSSDLLS